MLLNLFSMTDLRPRVKLMHYYACADVVTKDAENGVSRAKLLCPHRKMAALNSSNTSNFKPEVVIWSKLRSALKNRQNRRKAASDGKKFYVI